MNHIQGFSSLFFIISAIKSIYVSNNKLWKASNIFLVLSSYLCNATDYIERYLFMDHIAIIGIGISYINLSILKNIIFHIISYDYYLHGNLENSKDTFYIIAIIKSVVHTSILTESINTLVLILSIIIGVISINTRRSIEIKDKSIIMLLTWVWHFCMMNVLYISSITS